MTHNDNGYNGWPNYETWAAYLWLTNDEGSYNTVCQIVRNASSIGAAAGQLQEVVEEGLPDLGASLASDLLTAAFKEIGWYEVAESLWVDLHDEDDEDDEDYEDED